MDSRRYGLVRDPFREGFAVMLLRYLLARGVMRYHMSPFTPRLRSSWKWRGEWRTTPYGAIWNWAFAELGRNPHNWTHRT